jgi:sugar phosphate isomerase/epimerase
MECAAALGARNLKVSPMLFDENPPNIPLMSDEFAKLCEQARPIGTNVIMEMMPFTNVKTIDDAVAIVARADQPNGGLLLDIWHVARGGMDYREIAKVPARYLMGVELDDATSTVVGTLFEDTRFQRLLCGEGSFNPPAFIAAVLKAGFSAPYYGVEIISETFRHQPLQVMAQTSYDSTIKQFQALPA